MEIKQWYCDVCDNPIKRVEDGYVIWKTSESTKSTDFKIIHQGKCDLKDHHASLALEDLVGIDGLSYLMSFLSIGPVKGNLGQGSHCQIQDFDAFVDFVRRLQVPNYEEARRHFNDEEYLDDHCDDNEVSPYRVSSLESAAKKYGK